MNAPTLTPSRQTPQEALVHDWLPALGAPVDRLDYGGTVAVIGCGRGTEALLLAARHPLVTVHGVDASEPMVDAARHSARTAGVERRCSFSVGSTFDVPHAAYDVVVVLDRTRDEPSDPVAAARRLRKLVADGGGILVVDPTTVDRADDDLAGILRASGFTEIDELDTSPFVRVLAAHAGA